MSKTFLTADHPDAFVDMVPKLPPLNSHLKVPVPCPVCRTFGGWNLELNAFPKSPDEEQRIRETIKSQRWVNLRHDMSAAEFRNRYVHFKAHCRQCNGWGYVEKGSRDEACVHDIIEKPTGRMCETINECRKCGIRYTVDSSG